MSDISITTEIVFDALSDRGRSMTELSAVLDWQFTSEDMMASLNQLVRQGRAVKTDGHPPTWRRK